VKEDTIVDIEH